MASQGSPSCRAGVLALLALASAQWAAGSRDCGTGSSGGQCTAARALSDVALIQRRATLEASDPAQCHTAEPGEQCYRHVSWARQHGVRLHPSWYLGLSANSSFESFQQLFYQGGFGPHHHGTAGFGDCGPPCFNTTTSVWSKRESANCYPGKGADIVQGGEPFSLFISLEGCQAACERSSGCTAFLMPGRVGPGRWGMCYLRKNVCLPSCKPSPYWSLHLAPEVAADAACTPAAEECHTAVEGERCFGAVTWAMHYGVKIYPSWYPGLSAGSSFEEFQHALHSGSHGDCQKPCQRAGGLPVWQASGESTGVGWCRAEVPARGWNLFSSCTTGTWIKVLTYNLFWWNLFGVREGNGGSAGKLIAQHGPYDVMAFQECGDAQRVLSDAGLDGGYSVFDRGHGLAIAFKTGSWQELSGGSTFVAEDRVDQYYGRRAVSWVRLQHTTSRRTVLFANHHGPLPINSGGRCGPLATAYGLLRIVSTHADAGDTVVMVGDLNADAASPTQRTLRAALHRPVENWVDAVFTSCGGATGRRLGTGGSDHEALEATLQI